LPPSGDDNDPPTGSYDPTPPAEEEPDAPSDDGEPDLPSGSEPPDTGDPFDVALCTLICLAALGGTVVFATCRKARHG